MNRKRAYDDPEADLALSHLSGLAWDNEPIDTQVLRDGPHEYQSSVLPVAAVQPAETRAAPYSERVPSNAALNPSDPRDRKDAPPTGESPERRGPARDPATARTAPDPDLLRQAIPPAIEPPRVRIDSVFTEDEDEPATDVARLAEFSLPPAPPVVRNEAMLLRMDGVQAGSVQALGQKVQRIGRDARCELRVDDGTVSRVHAEITWEGGRHVLRDQGSQNGVFVQGRRVFVHVLEDGDWIQVGPHVRFRYALSDASEMKLLQQLYESSSRDALTGAFNRGHFMERLATEVSFAKRHDLPTAVILFDIDHFKKVNDTFGHFAGDAVLRQVAANVRRRLRSDDVLARYGGEEFAIALRGLDLRGCLVVAERIRASIAAVPAVFESRFVPVTVSLGCAALTCAPEQTAETMLAVADRRLYLAKGGGRNRSVGAG